MDEGRKRTILIAASILVAPKWVQLDGRPSPCKRLTAGRPLFPQTNRLLAIRGRDERSLNFAHSRAICHLLSHREKKLPLPVAHPGERFSEEAKFTALLAS